MSIIIKNKETLIFKDFKFKCTVGEKGITSNKKEGDKKTPRGTYYLGDLFYRKDRNKKPSTKLKCIQIRKNMGWGDNVKDKKRYNKLIKFKKKFKCEPLFRRDFKYDFLIPITYNFKKRIPGKGSAIFLHLTNNYKGTRGCIALKKSDFLILLKLINKNEKIVIN